jgi:lipoprotein LpqH
VKRGLTVTVAAAAILAASISGCSSKSSTGSGSSSSSSTASSGGAAGTKVLIDGKDQQVSGTVVCTTMTGNVNIAIGGQATGVAAILTTDSPPQVKSVALGNVNGTSLGYTPGTGMGNASATKSGSTYKITGTATGADMSGMVTKPFEIDVTCP